MRVLLCLLAFCALIGASFGSPVVKRYKFTQKISFPLSSQDIELARERIYAEYRRKGYSHSEASAVAEKQSQSTKSLDKQIIRGELWAASEGDVFALAKWATSKSMDGGQTWQKANSLTVEYVRNDGTFSILHGDPKTSELEVNDVRSLPWDQYDFSYTTGLSESPSLFMGVRFPISQQYVKGPEAPASSTRAWTDRNGVEYTHRIRIHPTDGRLVESSSQTKNGTAIFDVKVSYSNGQMVPSSITKSGLSGTETIDYLGDEKKIPSWFGASVVTMGPMGIMVNDARGGAHSASYALNKGPLPTKQAQALGAKQEKNPLNNFAIPDEETIKKANPLMLAIGILLLIAAIGVLLSMKARANLNKGS